MSLTSWCLATLWPMLQDQESGCDDVVQAAAAAGLAAKVVAVHARGVLHDAKQQHRLRAAVRAAQAGADDAHGNLHCSGAANVFLAEPWYWECQHLPPWAHLRYGFYPERPLYLPTHARSGCPGRVALSTASDTFWE